VFSLIGLAAGDEPGKLDPPPVNWDYFLFADGLRAIGI
jgi:hypothetical protein